MNNEHCDKCGVSYDSDYQSCGCKSASVHPVVIRDITVETRVRDWLYREGELPSDLEITVRLKDLASEWRSERGKGMDILAAAIRDELSDLIEAIEELI